MRLCIYFVFLLSLEPSRPVERERVASYKNNSGNPATGNRMTNNAYRTEFSAICTRTKFIAIYVPAAASDEDTFACNLCVRNVSL